MKDTPRKPMTRVQVYLTARQLKELGKLAVERGISMAEQIRRALDHFIEAIFAEGKE